MTTMWYSDEEELKGGRSRRVCEVKPAARVVDLFLPSLQPTQPRRGGHRREERENEKEKKKRRKKKKKTATVKEEKRRVSTHPRDTNLRQISRTLARDVLTDGGVQPKRNVGREGSSRDATTDEEGESAISPRRERSINTRGRGSLPAERKKGRKWSSRGPKQKPKYIYI